MKSSHNKELKDLAKEINQDIEKYMQRAIKYLPEEEDNDEVDDNDENRNEDETAIAENETQETNISDNMDMDDCKEEVDMDIDGIMQQNETSLENDKEQNVGLELDYKEEFEDVNEESEDEHYIPAHTEISLFQKYLQHPLFNDD